MVHDEDDDKAFMDWALAAHAPAAGRITVHPAPAPAVPAALAHDLLRALGKRLPWAGSEEGTCWMRDTRTAWRAVVAWVQALEIGHVLLTRAHLVTAAHLTRLFALAHLTGIRLTLVCHGPLAPAAAAAVESLRPVRVYTLTAARRIVPAAPVGPVPGRFPWWEPAPFPPPADEACLPPPGHSPLPDEHLGAVARRLHSRIAHPAHAAALAAQVMTSRSLEHIISLPPSAFTSTAVPVWAAGLIEAGRRFRDLDGRADSRRLFHLTGWDRIAVEEAALACGLGADHPPPPDGMPDSRHAPPRGAEDDRT
ncbi:hypothetical protein [Streptomyces katsurahamanus]|uniref:Uncharacterized protein n=1 Tax=Streptomyces katsurahamanus TaxID=2577098 RepID=A0ABW9NMP0_9ACTN|nr:hypothetical protein [Streptomyces katsurahamanus]MQS34580.1 hypothetical protein [Streptomyces katsurahamanus]